MGSKELMHGSLMNKKFFAVLLILLFVSIVGLTFHYHEDGTYHDDCAICSYVSHPVSFVLQGTPQISVPSLNILHIPLERPDQLSCLSCSPYSNRAPPVF
jgi:hypothetical protein